MNKALPMCVIAGALLVALSLAGQASAGNLAMTGEWFMNRGPFVDIPINGGPVGCAPQSAPSGCVSVKGAPGGLRQLKGGVLGFGVVAAATDPTAAPFTIPPNQFAFDEAQSTMPVTPAPSVLQLATDFEIRGPAAPGDAEVPVANQPARFMKDAWSLDPGQAGRGGPNFAWCPGFGSGCVDPGDATGPIGTVNGKVTYTAGMNKFGGTMAAMLGGIGNVSITVAVGANTTLMAHQPVGGGLALGAQAAGRGYASLDTDVLGVAPAYGGWGTAGACVNLPGAPAAPPGCELITKQSFPAGALPADKNSNWGFPWTTGTVAVSNTGSSTGGDPLTTEMTLTGTDNRTSKGAGMITLVAGATSFREGANRNFAALDIVTLKFTRPGAAPSGSFVSYGVLATLMLLSAGYVFRRHLVRQGA